MNAPADTTESTLIVCGCEENGDVDRTMLDLALEDGREVELPCGHTVSPPGVDEAGERHEQPQRSDAQADSARRLRVVERPWWLGPRRRDIDRHTQRDDPVHEGRVTRVYATALGRQHGRGISARPSRREVSEVVDELVAFDELGSLTDRARLREQVMARLHGSRDRTHDRRQRGRGGWSL